MRIDLSGAQATWSGVPGRPAPTVPLRPDVDPTAWVAPTAVLVGAVTLLPGANVWYGCVLRGDGDLITIGAGSNIQDLTVIHADPGTPVTVGSGVTVGHRAVLHGCTVGDDALIGMGAIVLNRASIGAGSLVGAGALVPEGMDVPPRSLVLGSPAKVRRSLTDAEQQRLRVNADVYVALTDLHRGPGESTD